MKRSGVVSARAARYVKQEGVAVARIRLSDARIDEFYEDMRSAERRISEAHRSQWEQITKAYEGRGRHEIALGLSGLDDPQAVNFNFLLSIANSVVPSILGTDPYIEFRSRTKGDNEPAMVAEAGVNFAYAEGRTNDTVAEAVLDNLLYGAGIAKVVFNPAGNVVPVLHYDEGAQIELEADDGLTSLLQEELGEYMPYDLDSGIDIPTLERVPLWNFLYPDGYDSISKCPWVAHKLLVRLEDLRMYPGFRVAPGIVANDSTMSPAAGYIGEAMGEYTASQDPSFVTLYEIHYWVRRGTRLTRRILWLLENTTAQGFDRVVRHIADDSGMRGYPFIMLRTANVPGKMYEPRVADLASIWPIAQRLNDELAAVVRHHRQASRQKYAAAPGALSGDSSFADMLASDADLDVAELPSQMADVRAALQLVPIAPMPADVPFVLQLLQRMMYEVGGVDSFQRGGVSRKGTTATEVAVASQAYESRAGVRKRAVQQFVEQVARRYLDCMRRYWTSSTWVRTAGGDHVEVTSEKMRGAFDIRAHVSDYDPDEQRNELEAFTGLMQTISVVTQTVAPLVQANILPGDTIARFIDNSFRIWRQDKRRLVGALSQMASPVTGGGGAPSAEEAEGPAPGEDPTASQVDGRGFSPLASHLSLAGTGPRPGPGGIQE